MDTDNKLFKETCAPENIRKMLEDAHVFGNEYGYGKRHDSRYDAWKRCRKMVEKGWNVPRLHASSFFYHPEKLVSLVDHCIHIDANMQAIKAWNPERGDVKLFMVCRQPIGAGFMPHGNPDVPMEQSVLFVLLTYPYKDGLAFSIKSCYSMFNRGESRTADRAVDEYRSMVNER